jgi:hypothetical protein
MQIETRLYALRFICIDPHAVALTARVAAAGLPEGCLTNGDNHTA